MKNTMLYQNPNDIEVHDNPELVNEWRTVFREANVINENTPYDKLSLLSRLATVQSRDSVEFVVNEAAPTLGGFPGVGNVATGNTLGGQSNFVTGAPGSGDKFVSPFAVAMQAAAKTVGFDIVSTIPISAPAGFIYHSDWIYADGTIGGTGKDAVIYFKLNTSASLTEGSFYFGLSTSAAVAASGDAGGNAAYIQYVGRSRKTGYPIFKLISTGTFVNDDYTVTNDLYLAQIFDGSGGITTAANANQGTNSISVSTPTAVTASADYVSAMEDHIYGMANGAGGLDGLTPGGNYNSGLNLYEPALRGEAEVDEWQDMGFRIVSKMIETKTFKVSASLTQEHLNDMRKQHGFDLIAKTEQALVNELSQNINRNILARAFALGWTHHSNILVAEGVNFNLAVDASYTTANVDATFVNNANVSTSIVIPAWQNFSTSSASFDNQETLQRRIISRVNAASDMLAQRNRIGGATGIVTNTQIASALKNISGYTASPFASKMATGGTLYPAGSIGDMQIFVDPLMRYSDTRVLVFRKGADDEPGLKFLPYILGDSVSTINTATGGPRIFLSSRYALTEYGQHPEMHYLTFFVKVPAGLIV